jgi:catechol 2,3-dioxygenase-like lactoylglutathione lyase family enzyme
MLGRFLEISLHAPEIRESLEFYESLGFVQASVGETWPYPYAVVTDGRLFIGLHAAHIRSPTLTFVLPKLARAVAPLRELGLQFDQERLGEDVFNQVTLRDPTDLNINLIEARTFSPPQLELQSATTCGYFTELGLPVREAQPGISFWEPLGFVAMEEELLPFARTALTSDHLNLALYRARSFRHPVLTFEDADMRERIARLRQRGLKLSDEMPDTLDDSSNAVLIAPEGTRLLLLQSDG